MGFYDNIRIQHGQHIVQLLKGLSANRQKIGKLKNRRIFLLRCRSYGLIPKHIIHSTQHLFDTLNTPGMNVHKLNKLIKRIQRDLLNTEISTTISNLMKVKRQVYVYLDVARWAIPVRTVNRFMEFERHRLEKEFNQDKKRLIEKFEDLKRDNYDVKFIGSTSNLENLTNVQVPEEVQHLLSLGPTFAIEPSSKELKTTTILSDLEYAISQLTVSEQEKDVKRVAVSNAVINFKLHDRYKNVDTVLARQYNKTVRFFKENPDIICLKSDKGNKSVLLSKQQYNEKMEDLLHDNDVYTKVKSTKMITLQSKANSILRDLCNDGHIDENQRLKFTKSNPIAARIYGLPKLHKPNIPFRPVVSCIGSPTYEIAKLLHEILANVAKSFRFDVKNSQEVADKIKGLEIPNDFCLVSFDVISLFTNVKKQRVVKSITRHWNAISEYTTIPFETFIDMVQFVFDNNFFTFNKEAFHQKSGCAMGSPASPIFSDFVMNDLIEEFVELITFGLPFFALYVDDSATALPKDMVQWSLDTLNSLDPDIQFTVEVEIDNKLPFLDILLINDNGPLKIDYYRKPSAGDRILNFYSHHPLSQRLSVISQFVEKVVSLCSDEFVDDNISKLKQLFLKNNYPISLIDSTCKKAVDKIRLRTLQEVPGEVTIQESYKYVKAPYHRELAPVFKRIFRNTNVRLAFYNSKTNKRFFGRVKDDIPTLLRSDVIYKIPCNCGLNYYGRTTQLLKNRLYQHNYDISKIKNKTVNDAEDKRNKTEVHKGTGISLHIGETNHEVQWDKVEVVDTQSNFSKLCFLEMAHIVMNKPNLNIQTDYKEFHDTYTTVLNRFNNAGF